MFRPNIIVMGDTQTRSPQWGPVGSQSGLRSPAYKTYCECLPADWEGFCLTKNRAASLTVADNTSDKSVYQYNNIKIVLVISTGHLELYHAARGCS